MRKCPLAALLVERGIFESADEALRWVMAGQVLVNDQRIDKPGLLVPCDATLRVRGRQRYASRGGYKLEAALEHFAVNVAGCVALDCGASTGGFTDCLLQHGAALVYAVEVGYGQLVGRLRADPRVRNLERTNLSDLISTPTINWADCHPERSEGSASMGREMLSAAKHDGSDAKELIHAPQALLASPASAIRVGWWKVEPHHRDAHPRR